MLYTDIERPICVFDSGVGGLAVLNELVKLLPYENYVYLSDGKNLPFGNKNRSQLLLIAQKNINEFNSLNPKAIVVACNTLSVVLGEKLHDLSFAPVFGVVPPVQNYKAKRECVFATPATAKYLNVPKNVDVYPLIDMAEKIELGIMSTDMFDPSPFLPQIPPVYDVAILGCTHYSLIKSEFEKHLKTPIVTDGCKITALSVYNSIKHKKKPYDFDKPKIEFIGDYKQKNKVVFKKIFNFM